MFKSIIKLCYYGFYVIPAALSLVKTTSTCSYYAYKGINAIVKCKKLKY